MGCLCTFVPVVNCCCLANDATKIAQKAGKEESCVSALCCSCCCNCCYAMQVFRETDISKPAQMEMK